MTLGYQAFHENGRGLVGYWKRTLTSRRRHLSIPRCFAYLRPDRAESLGHEWGDVREEALHLRLLRSGRETHHEMRHPGVNEVFQERCTAFRRAGTQSLPFRNFLMDGTVIGKQELLHFAFCFRLIRVDVQSYVQHPEQCRRIPSGARMTASRVGTRYPNLTLSRR